jgi:hypothetical protein
MVEFAFVSVLLVLLVLGVVNFGLILSFKQDVTRAASEGARVGAVEQPPAVGPVVATDDRRHKATVDGTEDAVDSFGQECGVDGMECEVTVHDCSAVPVPGDVTYWDNGIDDCVTVELTYLYDEFPLLARPPLLGSALPDTISAKSVARLNE